MASDVVDWQEAELPMLSEAAAAAWESELGRTIVCHRGRWWLRVVFGFYQPIRPLIRLRPEEATRPALSCWCLRAGLDEMHAGAANASVPVHVLPELRGYGLEHLSKSQRRRVRNGLRDFDVVALKSPELLLEQGYALTLETQARNPGVPLRERDAFERWVRSYFSPPRGLMLAALRRGQLLAFNANSAVEGVAYGDAAYVGAEGLRHGGLAACLFYVFAMIASRSAGVEAVFDGMHARENESLCDFKYSLGLRIAHVPTRVWFAPLAEPLLRRARPHVHYRLIGCGKPESHSGARVLPAGEPSA